MVLEGVPEKIHNEIKEKERAYTRDREREGGGWERKGGIEERGITNLRAYTQWLL